MSESPFSPRTEPVSAPSARHATSVARSRRCRGRWRRGHVLGWCSTVVAAAGAATVVTLGVTATGNAASVADAPEHVERAISAAEGLSEAFEYAADVIRPSLVSIITEQEVQGRSLQMDPFGGNSPFRDFFGDDFFRRFEQQPGQQPQQVPPQIRRGQGSGFIMTGDGYIMTNHHVVAGATRVTVRFSDDREMTAEVVGSDPQTDVAVVKVDASGLVPVKLGDSDGMRVGQWVIAAGSPFGLNSTITAGIVSATSRTGVGLTDYEDFIQTDAAINPGNSGGPLLNLRGEVIGMNTAIASRSGAFDGVGFAIPINMAERVLNSLVDHGAVVRGYLGVNIQELTQGLARTYGYDSAEGVLVSQVQPDTPAADAGLKNDDIIVSFNGRPVRNTNELRLRVAETAPGSKAEMVVFREGRRRELTVEIGELTEQVAADSSQPGGRDNAEPETADEDVLGLTVSPLNDQLTRRLNLPKDVEGVVVTAIDRTGLAARAGVQAGDVIMGVNGEKIEDVDDLHDAASEANPREGVRLTIRRGPARLVLFVQSRG